MPKSRAIALSLTALTLLAGMCAPARADFRVLPYLQSPTPSSITLNWFTVGNVTGTITITGPGLASPIVATTTPVLMTELDYGAAEKAINPRPADMYPDNSVWKHTVTATGLLADSQYTYTVVQGSATFSRTFRTAPTAALNRSLRLAVFSDSETLINGRTTFREWARTTPQGPGSTGRPAGSGRGRDRYLVTETVGYQQNIAFMDSRNPDLVIMPGDLIEGTVGVEAHRRWDEFWRHNAGEYDDLLTKRAIVPAIGNNCIFTGQINLPDDATTYPDPTVRLQQQLNRGVNRALNQWRAYWDMPAATTSANPAAAQDLYYRQDFGPVTILTLCSVGATEAAFDQTTTAGLSAALLTTGTDPGEGVVTDTNRAWLSDYPFGDLPDFNIATAQYAWAAQQLADARAAGQIIFVQWHHTPFSRGIHGTNVTSNQSGEAMRVYAPLLEQFRVAGVFCGHSEVAERSFVDTDADTRGFNLWDVGAAGDGLRGVEDAGGTLTSGSINAWRANPLNPLGAAWKPNVYHQWAADQNNAEVWNGNRLLDGGKHYGYLEVNVEPLPNGEFLISYLPWHIFPLNAGDAGFTVTGFEPRLYQDTVVMRGVPGDLKRFFPRTCLADITGIGGLSGPSGMPDGQLTVDDIIQFLESFMNGSLVADVTGVGGVGIHPDGQLSVDDVIEFVNSFMNGC